MKIRILKSKGGFEYDITQSILMFLFCVLFVFVLLMVWVFFFPQPRVERVKIAMHDEQTYQQLRQKHGKKATGVVIYEAGGKTWYYKDGQKVNFK